MIRKFILDKEIVLNKEEDLLNTSHYAENLVQIINNAPNGKVFTVGLFGSWGAGKSSIIATAKDKLETQEESKIKFITYDAWKYVNDSFRRMFLLKIQQELKQHPTEEMQRFYQSETSDVEPKTYVSRNFLGIFCLVLLIILIIVNSISFEIETKLSVASCITLVGLLITIFGGIFQKLKIQINKPIIFAPEQFEDCFKDMVSKSLKERGFVNKTYKKIKDYVETGECSITNLNKLVIIIDNIDRCSNMQAYHLLTDIKTFLCDEPFSIVFVIPVDDEALRKHIISSTNNSNAESCTREKEEFLRKFFNVTLRIKPHLPTEMFEFAQKLNYKYSLGFNSATVNIASKEYAKNPRRVIQLFNNLSVELENYDVEFAAKYETLICKILIIREEYNIFYKELLNDYTLFDKLELPKALNEKEKTELKRLLVDTKSYTSDYNSTVLSRILSNSESQFADVPLKIREVVDSNNYDEAEKLLLGWIENKSNMNAFVGYCLLNIDKAIRRQLFDSEFKACIEFIAQVNNKYEFTRDLNLRISERLQDNFKDIIQKINEP